MRGGERSPVPMTTTTTTTGSFQKTCNKAAAVQARVGIVFGRLATSGPGLVVGLVAAAGELCTSERL